MTTEIIFVIILTLFIVLLMVDRYLLVRTHNEEKNKLLDELSKAVKAVISKNANDYVMTTSIDKVAPEKPVKENPDLVDEEQLTDDEFTKSIGKSLKEE